MHLLHSNLAFGLTSHRLCHCSVAGAPLPCLSAHLSVERRSWMTAQNAK